MKPDKVLEEKLEDLVKLDGRDDEPLIEECDGFLEIVELRTTGEDDTDKAEVEEDRRCDRNEL